MKTTPQLIRKIITLYLSGFLLLASCSQPNLNQIEVENSPTSTVAPTSVVASLSSVASPSAQLCDLDVRISSTAVDNQLLPGDMVVLSAKADGPAVEYFWEAEQEQGFFSSETGEIVEFTAPDQPGTIVITVTVTSQSCEDSVTESIVLFAIGPTETPTSIPSPTLTSTPEPIETFTPAPTNTPQIIPSPVPTVVIAPVITRLEVILDTLFIEWSWADRLNGNESFGVRLWSVNSPDQPKSLVWQDETEFAVKINNDEFPAGEYFIHIAVYEGPHESHRVVVKSETLRITLPDIDPPDTGTDPCVIDC